MMSIVPIHMILGHVWHNRSIQSVGYWSHITIVRGEVHIKRYISPICSQTCFRLKLTSIYCNRSID